MPEPLPVSDVLSELNSQWNASNVTKPTLIEYNGGQTTTMRMDLNNSDYLVGQPGSPTLDETPLGNWKYVDRRYSVILELTTKNSRQRLYDLMAEVRRICHSRVHSMTNFQRLQFSMFNETIGDDLNVWSGMVEVFVVNTNIVAET
tara:strand:- start:1357 stop:1794 length:438 start_codon:yes stop_codon:yes gene_type:complete